MCDRVVMRECLVDVIDYIGLFVRMTRVTSMRLIHRLTDQSDTSRIYRVGVLSVVLTRPMWHFRRRTDSLLCVTSPVNWLALNTNTFRCVINHIYISFAVESTDNCQLITLLPDIRARHETGSAHQDLSFCRELSTVPIVLIAIDINTTSDSTHE